MSQNAHQVPLASFTDSKRPNLCPVDVSVGFLRAMMASPVPGVWPAEVG